MAKRKTESEISVLQKELEKEYGPIFHDFNKLLDARGDIIPTTLSLDIGLNGGIVEGTVVSIAGNPASGKTSLCLTIAANAQKMGKRVYYIDVEGRLQPELLSTIPGLDTDSLEIIRSTIDKFLTAEDYLNIINKLISSEKRILVILDSVATLCADNLYGAEHGESKKMMSIPSLMYDCLRKAAQILPCMNSNLILITHTQANPAPYGGPTEMGGNAIKFQASYRITCLSSKETPEQEAKKTGRESKFRIYKSALGPGTGDAIFYIRYGHGYDKYMDLVNISEELGLLSKSASWYSFEDEKGKELKLQGKNGVIEYLMQNLNTAEFLESSIRNLAFSKE